MAIPSQKVIIPRGLVNPYETTIIEIPKKLQNKPAVVAKPKSGSTYLIFDRKVDSIQKCYDENYTQNIHQKREEIANYIRSTISDSNVSQNYKKPYKDYEVVQEFGDVQNTKSSYTTHKKHKYYYVKSNHEKSNKNCMHSNDKIRQEKSAQNMEYSKFSLLNKKQSHIKYKKKLTKPVRNEMESINTALEQMEHLELDRIQKDLKDFQEARRKLILHATNIHA